MKSDVEFAWNPEQEKCFIELKRLCSTHPVLKLYDVNKPVEVHCDASKDGLGAVLMQDGRPVAYSSRSLTDTEKRYAQIEKEMLSIVHACTKFHCFIFGKETIVFNDHKPLEMIFQKSLSSAPMRLQKMLLKLQWYNLKVRYRKGTEMTAPDALSRAYLPEAKTELDNLETISMLDMLDVTPDRYSDIAQRTRTELADLLYIITNGWPELRSDTPPSVREYWDSRDTLSVIDGIIFKGMRIVIPPSLRDRMLKLIHQSHLGIVKCKQRGREVLFWPTMNAAIENEVRNCSKCAQYQNKQTHEPLKPTITPDLPYSEVGCDLFDFDGKPYLMIVDYFSRYFDAIELNLTNTKSVVNAMKSVFSCHGIPRKLRSDNGPQFNSKEFRSFCDQYGIQHVTSSPHFQSSNGEAERAIQTVKKLWRKSDDKYLSLLDYRTTPLETINLSPAQLLMGRRPRNTLPTRSDLLKPMKVDSNIKERFETVKSKQKQYHDRKYVKELVPLKENDQVRIAPTQGSKEWKPGIVIARHESPRSYIVESANRQYRRNRQHLRVATEKANRVQSDNFEFDDDSYFETERVVKENVESSTNKSHFKEAAKLAAERKHYVTSSGRTVKPPARLDL